MSRAASIQRFIPYIALAIVWVVWGSTYLAMRVAVETIPPFVMAGIRYTIAGVLMTLILAAFNRHALRMPTKAQWIRIAITGALLLLIGNGLICFGEQRVPSGIAALVAATVPLWMLVFDAAASRKRPPAASIVGLVLGTAGMALLVGVPRADVQLTFVLLIAVASFSWALGSVIARRSSHEPHPLQIGLEMTVGGVLLLIAGLATGEFRAFDIHAASQASLYAMLWLITAGAMIGYSAYGIAVRALPTPIAATYAYVNPIVAVLLGAWLLHEAVTWNVVAGGIAIVGAVVAIAGGQRTSSRREIEDVEAA